MPWLVLLTSAVLEAVWASALAASDGLSVLLPSAVFVVAGALSMLGLANAVRTIPIGTAYAVWTGVGAALTVTWAMTFGQEPFSVVKLVLLGGIVGAVIGLKLVSHTPTQHSSEASTGEGPRP